MPQIILQRREISSQERKLNNFITATLLLMSLCMSGFKNSACACRAKQSFTWQSLISVERPHQLLHKIRIDACELFLDIIHRLPWQVLAQLMASLIQFIVVLLSDGKENLNLSSDGALHVSSLWRKRATSGQRWCYLISLCAAQYYKKRERQVLHF